MNFIKNFERNKILNLIIEKYIKINNNNEQKK